jgi:hypothetical protein
LIIEDNSILFGNGLRAMLERQGYVRFRRTGVNDWYAARGDTLAGDRPEHDYRTSMVRARGLMIRRNLSDQLMATPGIGGAIGRLLRALRGRSGD